MTDMKIPHLKKSIKSFYFHSKILARDWGILDIDIFFDYEELLQKFISTEEEKSECDLFFKDSQMIDVIYEDLSKDNESEMKRIQEFLGVNYESLKPSTYKQSSQPLSKSISNYFELKEKFQGTPWSKYFED